MNHPKNLPAALLAVFAVETLSVTWCLKIPGGTPLLSILYFASGIAIAFLTLFFPAIKLPPLRLRSFHTRTGHYRLMIAALVILATWSWCTYWFEEMPIDITNADMLPIIKVMGERFIAGRHSHIYDTIPWIWKGTQPIYLPAMWLPYVPAIALGIDMRWIAIAGLLFAFLTFLFLYRPHTHPYLSFFLGVLVFLLFWWMVADNTAGIVSVAEEGPVIGYYVLLLLALLSGKPWLTGIAISLCMLSRYALVGWIPAYLLWLVLEKKWKDLLAIGLTGSLCFVLLFLLPVGWTVFLRLARLPGDYIAFADRVWKDSPEVFSTAPGLAAFFGPARVGLLHGLLVTLSFLVPLLFLLLGRRLRTKPQQQQAQAVTLPRSAASANWPVAALKLTLVIFYCFIDVPYLYLFYTSSFVSLIIVCLILRESV